MNSTGVPKGSVTALALRCTGEVGCQLAAQQCHGNVHSTGTELVRILSYNKCFTPPLCFPTPQCLMVWPDLYTKLSPYIHAFIC